MKSPVLKRTAQRRLAIGALLLAPLLGACGFSAQTDQPYQAAAGPNYRSGDVYILDAIIVSGTDGLGTFAGTLVNKTSSEAVLTSVTGTGIKATFGGGETLKVPAYGDNGYNNLGEAGDTVPPVKLALSGPATVIKPGENVTLTFTFSTGKTATLSVPVVPVGTDYTDVPLPAVPGFQSSPLASPDASPSAG